MVLAAHLSATALREGLSYASEGLVQRDRTDIQRLHSVDLGRPESWQFTAESLFTAVETLWKELGPAVGPAVSDIVELEQFNVRIPKLLDRLARKDEFEMLNDFVRRMRLVAPFKLLVGLAFENMMKGLFFDDIAKKKGLDPQGGLRREIDTHNLVRLAEVLQLSLNRSERLMLSQLSDYVEFAGRYPAPKRMKPGPNGPLVGDNEYDLITAFMNRLRGMYLERSFMPAHLL
jgi:hypothetical protein